MRARQPADGGQLGLSSHQNPTTIIRSDGINGFVVVVVVVISRFHLLGRGLAFAVPALRRSSIGTFIRPNSSDGTQPKPVKAQPKLDYRSMISIDDMPELFVSVDSKYLLSLRVCRWNIRTHTHATRGYYGNICVYLLCVSFGRTVFVSAISLSLSHNWSRTDRKPNAHTYNTNRHPSTSIVDRNCCSNCLAYKRFSIFFDIALKSIPLRIENVQYCHLIASHHIDYIHQVAGNSSRRALQCCSQLSLSASHHTQWMCRGYYFPLSNYAHIQNLSRVLGCS